MSPSELFCAHPVYPGWLRFNVFSGHDAILPPAPPSPIKRYPHQEFSAARGLLPPFQKFTTKVTFDGQPGMLEGHNHGPMAVHACKPPNNTLLVPTMIKSKCTWPIVASRRCAEGKNLAAFKTMLAPYVFCIGGAKEEKKSPAKAPPAKSSPKTTGPGSKAGAGASSAGGAAKTKALVAYQSLGMFMFPTSSQTVSLPLGLMDYLVGVLKIAASKAFDTVFDKAWARVGLSPKGNILQANAAAAFGATGAAARELAAAALKKTAKNVVKGLVNGASISVPYKLGKLDLSTGDITVWGEKRGTLGGGLSQLSGLPARGFSGWVDDGLDAIDPAANWHPGRLDAEKALTDAFLKEAPHVG